MHGLDKIEANIFPAQDRENLCGADIFRYSD